MSIHSEKVPFGQKIAFGIGMLANQMFPAALGIFMVVLVQDLGFPGTSTLALRIEENQNITRITGCGNVLFSIILLNGLPHPLSMLSQKKNRP